MANNISEIINAAADKAEIALKENSVFGDPITADGIMIIPVYKLSFGFGGGGSESLTNTKNNENTIGGAGAGVTKTPVAYITVSNGEVSVLNSDSNNNGLFSKILNLIPKKVKK